ncbi:MAG: hypothetical protein M3O70_09110, partial [Actinomycetota bacterium]|nr:hypothetical protein [Actinomycetota bacterium]
LRRHGSMINPRRTYELDHLELAQIGGVGVPRSKPDTGLRDHGVTTLCDHWGDLCPSCHHG